MIKRRINLPKMYKHTVHISLIHAQSPAQGEISYSEIDADIFTRTPADVFGTPY